MDFTGDESSESGEETIPPVTIRDQEPNIKTVPYGFIKSGKSTGDGILHTHNMSFRFYKRNANGKKDTIWWVSLLWDLLWAWAWQFYMFSGMTVLFERRLAVKLPPVLR